jgi:hypothetical protein
LYFGAATPAGKRASAAAESLTFMIRTHSSSQTWNQLGRWTALS